MTVEELIEELKRHPGHVEVKVLVPQGLDEFPETVERVKYCPASFSGKPSVELEVAES